MLQKWGFWSLLFYYIFCSLTYFSCWLSIDRLNPKFCSSNMRGLLLYLLGFSCFLRALLRRRHGLMAIKSKLQSKKKMTFPCGKILFLNSFVVVGQQIVHIQGWRKRGRKTLADVAPPRPSMQTLQENWIKKKVKTKKMTNPPPWPPPSHLLFNFCFRTFCLRVPCLPTFFLPRSLIVLDSVASNYLSTPPPLSVDSRLSKKIVLGPTFDRYSTSQDLTYIPYDYLM
jgi:hypothetical protein